MFRDSSVSFYDPGDTAADSVCCSLVICLSRVVRHFVAAHLVPCAAVSTIRVWSCVACIVWCRVFAAESSTGQLP